MKVKNMMWRAFFLMWILGFSMFVHPGMSYPNYQRALFSVRLRKRIAGASGGKLRSGLRVDGRERILDRRHKDGDDAGDGGNEVVENLLTPEQKYRLFNARYSNLYYDRTAHHNHAGTLLGL